MQSVSATQGTQLLVAGSHNGVVSPQLISPAHCTQAPDAAQMGFAPVQFADVAQGSQVWVETSQTGVVPLQSLSEPHCTQAPDESHTGVAPKQTVPAVHGRQEPELTSHHGVVPSQSELLTQPTHAPVGEHTGACSGPVVGAGQARAAGIANGRESAARRAGLFAIDFKVGEFGNNAVAMVAGELRGYGDDEVFRSVVATPTTVSEELGPPEPVPGLEGVDGHSPGVSEDELEIVLRFARGNQVQLRSASRSSMTDAFGSFVSFFEGPTGEMNIGAPELSYDCRSLYFVWMSTAGQGGVFQMRR